MSWWNKYSEAQIELAIANALAGGAADLSGTSNMQLLFNDSGTIAGDSTITIEGTPKALVVANMGSAFGSLAVANNDQGFPFVDSGTGFTVAQNVGASGFDYNSVYFYLLVDDPTVNSVSNAIFGTNVTVDYPHLMTNVLVSHYDGEKDITSTINLAVNGRGAGTSAGSVNNAELEWNFNAGANYNVYVAAQINTNMHDGAALTFGVGLNLSTTTDGTGTVGEWRGINQSDLGLVAVATEKNYVWLDSRGVSRINEDSRFNSVGQAISALYNPQFTKYTPGAADHERISMGQWNSNVAEIGTEKGGTGTLRKLRLIGAGLLLDATILPTSNPGAGQLWNDGNTVKVGT